MPKKSSISVPVKSQHKKVNPQNAKTEHHQLTNRKDVRRVDANAHYLHANLIVLVDYHLVVLRLVARRIGVRVELHVGGNGVPGDEAGERANLGEDAHLVDLRDDGVEDLALEGPEDDRLVLDEVGDEAGPRLDHPVADAVDGEHGDDEAVLARAGALNLLEQLLLHRVQQVGAKVPRVQLNLVLQLNVVEHFEEGEGEEMLLE